MELFGLTNLLSSCSLHNRRDQQSPTFKKTKKIRESSTMSNKVVTVQVCDATEAQ